MLLSFKVSLRFFGLCRSKILAEWYLPGYLETPATCLKPIMRTLVKYIFQDAIVYYDEDDHGFSYRTW